MMDLKVKGKKKRNTESKQDQLKVKKKNGGQVVKFKQPAETDTFKNLLLNESSHQKGNFSRDVYFGIKINIDKYP